MTRKRFPTTARMARLLEFNGKCAVCDVKIGPATGLEWDHIIPLAMGGEDEIANLQPLCRADHRSKTGSDATAIAKAKRLEAKHLGAYRSRSPLPGGKDSNLKRKVSGQTVARTK